MVENTRVVVPVAVATELIVTVLVAELTDVTTAPVAIPAPYTLMPTTTFDADVTDESVVLPFEVVADEVVVSPTVT